MCWVGNTVIVNRGITLGVSPDTAHDAHAEGLTTRRAHDARQLLVARHPLVARADDLLRRVPPLVAAVLGALLGLVTLTIVTIATGALLVEVVLQGDVQTADNDVNHWLADHRTPTWNAVSWVGSHLGQSVTVIAIVAVVAAVLVARHHAELAVFAVTALAVEAATYIITVQFIDRPRPAVHRMEALGPGASFPSGHTAAAVATYGGLAMLAVVLGARPSVRRALLALAVLAPLAVALGRMYRGMHHPLDVTLGAAMGVGCLAVGVLAAWSYTWSERARHAEPERVS